MLRVFLLLIIPVSLLALGFMIYPEMTALSAAQMRLARFLPGVIALITLMLALRFNRSRTFFSVLTLSLAYVILIWTVPWLKGIKAVVVYQALCVAVPFNLLVFSLLKERGMFTWWGSTRFALLALQIVLVAGLMRWYPAETKYYLDYPLVDQQWSAWSKFTQPVLVMMVLTLLILNGRLFAKPDAQTSALFGAFIAAVVMLHFKDQATASIVFASAAILMLVVAVIQDSYSMAYIDQLTDLPGRRALNERMLKLGGSFSIAMLDVDHFKKFNDRYGHDAGDEVLRMVASRIKQVGAGGKAFRYGGEEFSILFPGKMMPDVLESLNTIRQRIANARFDLRRTDRRHKRKVGKKGPKQAARVTISVGVANRCERTPSAWEVLKLADKALYRAKKQGRNRVCK
ncbi:MAG: GGDEF domain-containing protein [Gammaproteobacteria bacterium]|nr:MAG: GGDEF domain-containing protein [Gammaproteobacteria bacterium]